jgi:hypothetical protein
MSQPQATNALNEIEQTVTLCFNNLEEFFSSLAGNYGTQGPARPATLHSG